MILMMIFLLLLIAFILIALPMAISTQLLTNRENFSPFECGFDPKNNARTPFSLQFFLIAVIFLIFDVEIALLLPVPLTLLSHNFFLTLLLINIFLIILLLGLYYEWKSGALTWSL